jgi:hypothetical protein
MGEEDDRTSADEPAERCEPRVETCRVALWRGYMTASFYARSSDDTDGAIGEPSRSFRSRRGAVPDTEETRRAHRELVSRLEADGWLRTGGEGAWYETEFARTVLVPVEETADEPAPSEVAVVPESESEPEPEPEPVVAPVRPVQPPPPEATEPQPAPFQPEPPPPAAVPPARSARARTRRRAGGWRVAAAAGLVTAIGLLGWIAAHPGVGVSAPAAPPAPAAGAPGA